MPDGQTAAGADRTPPQQFCTFRVGSLLLGIDVQRVQEVIRPQPMTAVPLAGSAVRGLINLRGQIVTAIDLRYRLDLSPCEDDPPRMNAVVRFEDEAISLLVDEAGDVVEPDEDAFEPVPPTVSRAIRRLVLGAYKLPAALLLVLDTDAIASGDQDPDPAAAVPGTASRRTA